MKTLAFALIIHFSMLSLSPALCGAYEALQNVELCCRPGEACEKPAPEPKEERKEKDGPCAPCCPLVCHGCIYFQEIPEYDFRIGEYPIIKTFPITQDRTLSDYSTEYWQPPEVS